MIANWIFKSDELIKNEEFLKQIINRMPQYPKEVAKVINALLVKSKKAKALGSMSLQEVQNTFVETDMKFLSDLTNYLYE